MLIVHVCLKDTNGVKQCHAFIAQVMLALCHYDTVTRVVKVCTLRWTVYQCAVFDIYRAAIG